MTRVAVLGGGIAGAAACLRLQALGWSPLWLSLPEMPADKPGEQLAAGAGPLLEKLGLAHLLDSPAHRAEHRVLSSWGSTALAERHAMGTLEGSSTVLDRLVFEADLRRAVEARGTPLQEESVTQVTRQEGGWLLSTDRGDRPAGFVIDATGRRCLAGRRSSSRFRADRMVALYAFLEQGPGSDVQPSAVTLIEATEGGWWYASLLPDGRLALGYFTDPDLLPEGAVVLDKLLEGTLHVRRWLEEASFLVRPPRLVSAGTTWLAPCAGPDWAAVGDAAFVCDPLSSHGMTTALWTGMTAAEACVASFGGDGQALPGYAFRVAEGVERFRLSRREVYAAEKRFAGHPFWQRRTGLPAAP